MGKLKVFISWSGERSKVVATALDEWLRVVIQIVDPKFSPNTEKSTFWQDSIRKALTTDFGIICLTPENIETTWVQFEAGSLAKHEDGRVWTLLLCGLQPSLVKPPLSFIQHTLPDKEDIYQMLQSINNACGEDALHHDVLRRAFEKNWPDLEASISEAAAMQSNASTPLKADPNDMIEEILLNTRQLIAKGVEPPSTVEAIMAESFEREKLLNNAMNFWKKVQSSPATITSMELLTARQWLIQLETLSRSGADEMAQALAFQLMNSFDDLRRRFESMPSTSAITRAVEER